MVLAISKTYEFADNDFLGIMFYKSLTSHIIWSDATNFWNSVAPDQNILEITGEEESIRL